MPWQEVNTVDLRAEFVVLAKAGGLGFAELRRRFHISRKTGYKWLRRYRRHGAAGLQDGSSEPRTVSRQLGADWVRGCSGFGVTEVVWEVLGDTVAPA